MCRTLNEELAQRGSLETVCCMSVQAEVMLAPVDFLSADLQEAFKTASAPALRWWLAYMCPLLVRCPNNCHIAVCIPLGSCGHCETATGDNDGVPHLLASYDRVQVD